MNIHPVISAILETIKLDPAIGSGMFDAAIQGAVKSDKMYKEILDSVAADPVFRAVILRAIVTHASGKTEQKPAGAVSPVEVKHEIDHIFSFMRGKEAMGKNVILDGAKIPEGDRAAAWHAAINSGKLEMIGKGRGTAYRYKG